MGSLELNKCVSYKMSVCSELPPVFLVGRKTTRLISTEFATTIQINLASIDTREETIKSVFIKKKAQIILIEFCLEIALRVSYNMA